jgi:hypothetical protein
MNFCACDVEKGSSHASSKRSRKPDFLLVGAPKCGTTAMAHYLGQHPDIFMAQKEMHFFGADLRFGPQFYRRGRKAYLEEFSAANGQRCAGEASVWYLFSRKAAAEFKAFNPQARILIMLREPAEMLFSLYHQFRYDGNEHLGTFEQALAAQDERRAGKNMGRLAYFPQGLLYHQTACYTEQVERYFELFGRDQVRVLIYDDFAADPAAAYRETLDFLGVDPHSGPASFEVINGYKSTPMPLLRRLARDPLVFPLALAIRPWLSRRVFVALQRAEARLGETKAKAKAKTHPERRPSLAPELRARLKQDFAPEVERLSQLLGRDLTHWSK